MFYPVMRKGRVHEVHELEGPSKKKAESLVAEHGGWSNMVSAERESLEPTLKEEKSPNIGVDQIWW